MDGRLDDAEERDNVLVGQTFPHGNPPKAVLLVQSIGRVGKAAILTKYLRENPRI